MFTRDMQIAGFDDALWDAMQQCLIQRGELHNNARMTWGQGGRASLSRSPPRIHSNHSLARLGLSEALHCDDIIDDAAVHAAQTLVVG